MSEHSSEDVQPNGVVSVYRVTSNQAEEYVTLALRVGKVSFKVEMSLAEFATLITGGGQVPVRARGSVDGPGIATAMREQRAGDLTAEESNLLYDAIGHQVFEVLEAAGVLEPPAIPRTFGPIGSYGESP